MWQRERFPIPAGSYSHHPVCESASAAYRQLRGCLAFRLDEITPENTESLWPGFVVLIIEIERCA